MWGFSLGWSRLAEAAHARIAFHRVRAREWRGVGRVLSLGLGGSMRDRLLPFFLSLAACGGQALTSGDDKPPPMDAGEHKDATTREAAGGDGAIGAPCSSPDQCAAKTCLGSPFQAGYCTVRIAECSAPGGVALCPDGSICDNGVEAVVNGMPGGGDFCLVECTGKTSCRDGYSCCSVRGYDVCAPPSLCGT
jgi:hypothetical protein